MATLKSKFEELIHLTWDQFVAIEKDKKADVDTTVLCSLIRTCAETDDMSSIKLAFDRVDGLLETPVEIKVPKFYIRYINAKEKEAGAKELEASEGAKSTVADSYDPASAKLRETLQQMRKMEKGVIRVVFKYKKMIDEGEPTEDAPMVKSVIVANLLKNVTKGKFKAVELVFDQIDGKLTRTINLLGGEDVYVDDYSELVAPAHALKDENGVYYAEDKLMTTAWIRGFSNSQKGLESIVKGLEEDD